MDALPALRSSPGLLGGSHRSHGSCSLLLRLYNSTYGVAACEYVPIRHVSLEEPVRQGAIRRTRHQCHPSQGDECGRCLRYRVSPEDSDRPHGPRHDDYGHSPMRIWPLCLFLLASCATHFGPCAILHPGSPVRSIRFLLLYRRDRLMRNHCSQNIPTTEEDLVLQASARHQCLPFQAVERGRYQQAWRLPSLAARLVDQHSDRPKGPWFTSIQVPSGNARRVSNLVCRTSRAPAPFPRPMYLPVHDRGIVPCPLCLSVLFIWRLLF